MRQRPGKAPFAEFDLPKLPERGVAPPAADRMAAALGLIPGEIGFENHRPTIYSAGVPYVLVFTKTDKQSTAQTKALLTAYLAKMSEIWDELPRYFQTSAETGLGRDELLNFVAGVNQDWKADAAAGA